MTAAAPAPATPDAGATSPTVLQEAGKVLESARRQHEETMRAVMARYGLDDAALQDNLIAFLSEQSIARQPVRDQAKVVRDSMRSIVLSDEQVKGLMNDFRAMVVQEKTRYQAALARLDERIGFSRSPRLEAALTFVGIVGDEALFLGGPASFADFGAPSPGAMGVMPGMQGMGNNAGPSIVTPIIMQPIITPPIITSVITPGSNTAPPAPPAAPTPVAPAAAAPQ